MKQYFNMFKFNKVSDHMMNLSALLCTIFSLCYCSEGFNITFHANKTTWNVAVNYCAKSGGVLYSDEKDIRNRTNKEVWAGKYEAFTPWSITWGCYRIHFGNNPKVIFHVSNADQSECQKKCTGTDFFAIKGNICTCLQQTEVDEQRKEKINPCNCSTCVIVLRHRIDNVDIRSNTGCRPTNRDCTCMAAACIQNRLKHTPELCNQFYGVVCDNNHNATFVGQVAAKESCLKQNSILRRYTNNKDICELGGSQHWTSGKRSVQQYIVQYTDAKSKLNPLRCFRVTDRNALGSEYIQCARGILLPFFCKIDLTDNSTIKSTTILNNAPDLMVGIVVSIVVILLILIVLLVVLLRRKYQKDKLSLKTAGREDRDTNEMDNYIIILDYQQLDKVKNRKTNTKPYDQLHVKHPVDSYQTDDHSNTLYSREEHNKYESIENKNEIVNNNVTLEYEVLDKTQQDKMTKAYDQLHYPHVVDTDSTNNHSTTIIESEQKHKTSTNTTFLEYEELNNADKDKSVNVYEQLNVTNEGNFNANMSKTMISTAEHISNESIEAATAMDKHTVNLEYKQLDIAGKEEGINVYDQLHVTP